MVPDAELDRGAQRPDGDLAPVGDQDAAEPGLRLAGHCDRRSVPYRGGNRPIVRTFAARASSVVGIGADFGRQISRRPSTNITSAGSTNRVKAPAATSPPSMLTTNGTQEQEFVAPLVE